MGMNLTKIQSEKSGHRKRNPKRRRLKQLHGGTCVRQTVEHQDLSKLQRMSRSTCKILNFTSIQTATVA